MSVKKIKLKPVLTDKQCEALSAKLLDEDSYDLLVEENADVYCEETGQVIAKFRKNVIPRGIQKRAYENLKMAAVPSRNRGISGGEVEEDEDHPDATGTRYTHVKADGTLSNTRMAKPVNSGIIGYFDRNPRYPYCRQTAYNMKHFDKFKEAYPIIKLVDNFYSKLMPEQYKLQREVADKTSQEFVIKNTAFTTVTVNKDWQTAVHQDAGDFKAGFGNLVALRKGAYEGGYFVVPKWGVGFDLQNGDLLLVDVHQWHGNTPIKKITPDATRISLVMYYRDNMRNCGTSEQEREFAATRPEGETVQKILNNNFKEE